MNENKTKRTRIVSAHYWTVFQDSSVYNIEKKSIRDSNEPKTGKKFQSSVLKRRTQVFDISCPCGPSVTLRLQFLFHCKPHFIYTTYSSIYTSKLYSYTYERSWYLILYMYLLTYPNVIRIASRRLRTFSISYGSHCSLISHTYM